MKIPVTKLDEATVRRSFPIGDRVSGWFFRLEEQSPGVWRVEGTDLWGRMVSDVGSDEEKLLESCFTAAERINAQIAATVE